MPIFGDDFAVHVLGAEDPDQNPVWSSTFPIDAASAAQIDRGWVWRDGRGRQARLAQLLRAVDVRPVDQATGRAAGELVGRAGTSDPIDATVVLLADAGDRILTGDVDDLIRLAAAAESSAVIVAC